MRRATGGVRQAVDGKGRTGVHTAGGKGRGIQAADECQGATGAASRKVGAQVARVALRGAADEAPGYDTEVEISFGDFAASELRGSRGGELRPLVRNLRDIRPAAEPFSEHCGRESGGALHYRLPEG